MQYGAGKAEREMTELGEQVFVTAAVDEDKCARQSVFTNLLRCFTADKENLYKVRQDGKTLQHNENESLLSDEVVLYPLLSSIDRLEMKKCSNTHKFEPSKD